jgi:glutaredoxin 3
MGRRQYARYDQTLSAAIAKVEIYSTESCPFCKRAKHLLDSKGVGYTEWRIDRLPDLREQMEARSGRSSVPQIFIDERHIGGFDDLSELEIDGELDRLLRIENPTADG